ncbi:M16 family metallopeptidase [Roseitranquillus sediminis]|uniref:M16 family metallopeptidase n=1 Tax=Roseitranquillus sediminis TaxID=2809051 RepID=UPI001D0C68D9|nr:pitrilysin family protein [Roseitranquillus sediminis]MBM9593742.1 insulinase family protein [Roseitranquillus sediminis]
MNVQIATLSNGFRIVTERMPGLASASLGVWISAGGRHERVEQNGIAHFLEHMAFKGTRRRNARQIAEAIEDVGGYLNAYTSRETTAYYARVLEDDVPLALDVIADILLDPMFEPREIEVERGVILQEIGQVLDTPDDIVFDWLQEVSYPGQPIGRSILGPAERVGAFGRDDLTTFVAERYAPDQMILAAAGAVDHDAIVAAAERTFGHLAPRKVERPEPARFTGGERREIRPLEQVHFALAIDAPSYRDDDIYVSQVYASALGGGMSSRLFQEVRERHGLCYTIFAQAGAYADGGHVTVYAGTGEDQIADLARLTLDQIAGFAGDLNEAEVSRARAQMKAGLLMGLESPSSRAERLARMVAIWGRVPSLEETVARIDAVTADDVRRLSAEMTGSRGVALALYGPGAAAPDLDAIREGLAA